ncbi:MAG TPA: polysaccharide lyase [Pirellulaceae bacterium]|jgi:hypothetical protein|nr:polysaccharide lyase [Pirellulaceae bacterium]
MLSRLALPFAFVALANLFALVGPLAAQRLDREKALEATHRAAKFFYETASEEGGYVWVTSADGKNRQGEGLAYDRRIWIQPPGTPAVGEAFLEAWLATGDPLGKQAALDAANALVKTQLQSGGWHYSGSFDPEKRKELRYRTPPQFQGKSKADPAARPGGWETWRNNEDKANKTILDDDTSTAATRFLLRVAKEIPESDASIREAAVYALASMTNAQHPIGAWSHNYDRFPASPPDEGRYPILQASYPENWSRTWTKDFTGGYVINDRTTLNSIRTFLLAYETLGDEAYLETAKRGGDFLIKAQMPEPQPAWCQQYDRRMQPVWDRKFEPPAITGHESQDAIETLLLLYETTGDKRFLAPVPNALAYLKKSELPSGDMARFYELKTNRPLYFDDKYALTYDPSQAPDHYGFVQSSRLDRIERRYKQALGELPAESESSKLKRLRKDAEEALAMLSPQGAWLSPGEVRDPQGQKIVPREGVLSSDLFARNLTALAKYIEATKP